MECNVPYSCSDPSTTVKHFHSVWVIFLLSSLFSFSLCLGFVASFALTTANGFFSCFGPRSMSSMSCCNSTEKPHWKWGSVEGFYFTVGRHMSLCSTFGQVPFKLFIWEDESVLTSSSLTSLLSIIQHIWPIFSLTFLPHSSFSPSSTLTNTFLKFISAHFFLELKENLVFPVVTVSSSLFLLTVPLNSYYLCLTLLFLLQALLRSSAWRSRSCGTHGALTWVTAPPRGSTRWLRRWDLEPYPFSPLYRPHCPHNRLCPPSHTLAYLQGWPD